VTLAISFAVGLLFYLFFLRMYRKHASNKDYTLFETRQFHQANRSPPPFESTSLFASLREDYRITDTDLLRCVGLDSFMFLRFLRLGFRTSLVGSVLGCCILIPIYATGEATGLDTLEFNSITMAHLEDGSPRVWASAVCWTLFIGFVLREIQVEWKEYAPKRQAFMARGDVDTQLEYRYACRVENVPRHLASNQGLRAYFETMFPKKIHQVSVLLHAEQLEQLIQERQTAILKCESAMAMTHAKPHKPAPTCKVDASCCGVLGGTTVEAIPHYEDEIRRLNGDIDQERAALCQFADAAHLQDTATTTSKKLVTKLMTKLMPSVTSSKTEETVVDSAVVVGEEKNVTKSKQDIKDHKTESSSDHADPFTIEQTYWDEVGLLSKTDDANAKKRSLPDHEKNKTIHEGETSSTAFITFTSLRVKQAAIQCEVSGKVDDVDVFPAPLPNSIIWKNALVPILTQAFTSKIAAAFWLVGCLFWAVPVAFVTGIANLNAILELFGIAPLDANTFYYGLIAGLLPVIFLQLLMIILYLAIGACAMYGIRFKSMPEVDAYTFFWHQLFQFANLWLIVSSCKRLYVSY